MNEKNENYDLKNKDEPTLCTHSAPNSPVWHFLLPSYNFWEALSALQACASALLAWQASWDTYNLGNCNTTPVILLHLYSPDNSYTWTSG